MMDHLRFKGVSHYGDAQMSEQLEANLALWHDWCFLGIGAFWNVRIPTSGAFGGDFHRLCPAHDPYLEDGRAWQSARTNWVWETGVPYAEQPIRVSGVFVDGVFHPSTGVGRYAHSVDYPRGRVVFASGVPSSAAVSCEHSPRHVHFHRSDAPWWRQAQLDSFRPDDPLFLSGSGLYGALAENRVQLPAVVVDARPETQFVKGVALGGGVVMRQPVLYTVLAETPAEAKKVHDIIVAQRQKSIVLFDKNRMADAGYWPVTDGGAPGTGVYPDLVRPTGEGGFAWKELRCEDFASQPARFEPSSPVHAVSVRGLYEVWVA